MRRLLLLAALSMVAALVLAPNAMAQNTLNCEDFASQAAAQANLDTNPSDPNNLDADDDGLACETFDYGTTDQYTDDGEDTTTGDQYTEQIAPEAPTAVAPATTAEATTLPDTGGLPLVPVAAAGAALLLGGGWLLLVRR